MKSEIEPFRAISLKTSLEQVVSIGSLRTELSNQNSISQIAGGYNFSIAIYYPGLQGGAKSRKAAKNVFSRWRAKVGFFVV